MALYDLQEKHLTPWTSISQATVRIVSVKRFPIQNYWCIVGQDDCSSVSAGFEKSLISMGHLDETIV